MFGRSKGLFKPLLFLWLFFFFFFPLTIRLGYWQLDRAEEKRALLEERSSQTKVSAVPFSPDETPIRFKNVKMRGSFLGRHLFLDNRQHNGQVGYELVSLFKTDQEHLVLVNRGWVAAPRYRSALPELTQTDATLNVVDGVSIELSGYFYWPDKAPVVLQPQVEQFGEGIWRVQSLDHQILAETFSELTRMEEFRLHRALSEGGAQPVWAYQEIVPEKHQGYAVQWFAMATALLILTIVASIKLWPGANSRTT